MGLPAITKADREWFERITELGCIVGRLYEQNCWGELQRHHCKSGGRRISHQHSICLCLGHHQSGVRKPEIVSRHPWGREFVARYGSEDYLLGKTREMLGVTA